MNKLSLTLMLGGLVALTISACRDHQQNSKLREEIRTVQARMKDMDAEVAVLKQKQHRTSIEQQRTAAALRTSSESTTQASATERSLEQMAQLQARVNQLDLVVAGITNIIARSRAKQPPLLYSDSVKKDDYVFKGYDTPQAVLQSQMWALANDNGKEFLNSVTGKLRQVWERSFRDYPEGGMPSGFKNGMLYQSSGFRVMEEKTISDDEVELKVFYEGSRFRETLVIRKTDGAWKVADHKFNPDE
jgi:hypothetical protein